MKKRRKLQHTLQKMKLLVVCLLAGFCTCHASAFAQNGRISLNVTDNKLSEVFQQIEKLSGYMFIYQSGDLAGVDNISLNETDAELSSILDKCLAGTGLTYTFRDNLIIIQNKARQQADEKRVTGKVTDTKGHPLPGVAVIIKGTTMGVSTDNEGKYAITLPGVPNVRLMFTFIGMKPQEVAYAGQQEINVTLEEEATEIEEVVVTGYQTIDRRKNTSSVYSVKAEDLMIPGTTSIDQMLEGRIPDLILMSNSGEVGVVPKIRIRGTSTLVGNREPLWVVDGIIVQDPVNISPEELNDPDYINRIGNAIAGLNPQDIDRLDILKDAAATALYGTRAANGVIVITTKKGRVGPPVVQYSMTTTLRQRPRYTDRKINLMNSKERVQFSRELYDQHYSFENSNMNRVGYEGLLFDLYNGNINEAQFAQQVGELETMNTDWFDLLTKDSFSHQHTISISGGTEETRYYGSIGYTRDNDVIRGDYTQRYTAAINFQTNMSKWLTAYFQLLGNISERRYYQDEIAPMDYAYNTTRTLPAYEDNGEYYFYEMRRDYDTQEYNILNELDNSHRKQSGSGITANVNLQFKFADWLNLNAILSYSNSNTEIEGYWGERTYHAALLRSSDYGEAAPNYSLLPFGGELTMDHSRNNSYTVRLQLNANKYFGLDSQHNINGAAGFELSSTRYNAFSSTHRGYYEDRGKSFVDNINAEQYPSYAAWLATNNPTVTDNLTNMISGYISLSYSYKNYFTFNVNGRVDGSNKFGDQSNDKFLPIWSLSGNYNFSEHIKRHAAWIDNMSLKVSYGYQGNMLEDQSPVLLIQKLPLDAYYSENKASVARYPNPNLKWEKTNSLNVGLTFSFLEGNIQAQTEYYYKRTKDAFMTKEVASMNGVDSYVINGGDVQNQGFNVDVTFIPLKRKDWYWSISTSFSRNYNKMMNDPDAQTYDYSSFLNGTALVKGEAVNTFYSYDFVGLSPVDGGPMFNDYETSKHELFGLTRYETFTKVLKATGRREPYMSGSLTTQLTYKNFRLGGTFTYSLGAKTRLFRMFDDNFEPQNNVNRDFMDRWQHPGDELRTNIPALLTYNSAAYWKYNYQHYSALNDNIQTFATDYYQMYDYSDIRVVSANYLKCSNLSLTYRFGKEILEKLSMSRLELTLSGSNLFTICSKKLRGQTPTQGGFSEVQLSDRPTYSLTLNVSF